MFYKIKRCDVTSKGGRAVCDMGDGGGGGVKIAQNRVKYYVNAASILS